MTGKTDYAMAKVSVSGFGTSNGSCQYQPLTPLDGIGQPFEDYAIAHPNGQGLVDTADLQSNMKDALVCIENAMQTLGENLTLNSAYRPKSYQQHLHDVHQLYKKLIDNNDPNCADLKASIVNEETHIHHIVRSGAARGDSGQHVAGEALDMVTTGADLVQAACGCKLYRKYAPAAHYISKSTGQEVVDPPHYEINPGNKPCL